MERYTAERSFSKSMVVYQKFQLLIEISSFLKIKQSHLEFIQSRRADISVNFKLYSTIQWLGGIFAFQSSLHFTNEKGFYDVQWPMISQKVLPQTNFYCYLLLYKDWSCMYIKNTLSKKDNIEKPLKYNSFRHEYKLS